MLHGILAQLPNVHVTALVRDGQKAQRLEAARPGVAAVVGSGEDLDLIQTQSNAADIVISKLVCGTAAG